MHLCAVGFYQEQYLEPIAANRIHNAVTEVLAQPLHYSRTDLLLRIGGCWQDAIGILQMLLEARGKVVVDGVTGRIVAPITIKEELTVLSRDLGTLVIKISSLLRTREGNRRWDSSDPRFDARPIHGGLQLLESVANTMALTAQSVGRAVKARPEALNFSLG